MHSFPLGGGMAVENTYQLYFRQDPERSGLLNYRLYLTAETYHYHDDCKADTLDKKKDIDR
ncbi:MAG: hypothetical protein KJO04_01940 [Bacteroidia bacterium]|nr:hypothetical protein [Bacteroidia bacterium]